MMREKGNRRKSMRQSSHVIRSFGHWTREFISWLSVDLGIEFDSMGGSCLWIQQYMSQPLREFSLRVMLHLVQRILSKRLSRLTKLQLIHKYCNNESLKERLPHGNELGYCKDGIPRMELATQ